MIKDFPEIFNGGGGEPARWGLISMMRNVAQRGVHGHFDAVEQNPVRMIKMALDDMVPEHKAMHQQKPKTHGG